MSIITCPLPDILPAFQTLICSMLPTAATLPEEINSPPPFSFPEISLTTGLHNVNPYPLKMHCSRFPPQGTRKEKGEGERERGRTLPAADRVRSYTSLPKANRSLGRKSGRACGSRRIV